MVGAIITRTAATSGLTVIISEAGTETKKIKKITSQLPPCSFLIFLMQKDVTHNKGKRIMVEAKRVFIFASNFKR
jgi:uncharacterized membrane protein